MKRVIYVLPVVIFAVLAALLYDGLYNPRPSVLPSPLIGKTVPPFETVALVDETGFTRAELGNGKPTIVNFWASWCAPCRLEAPVLKELSRRTDLNVYGIVYKDVPKDSHAFLTEFGNPFSKINDDPSGRIGIEWGVTGVPETFVIDSKGIVRARHAGELTDEVVRDIILPAAGLK